MNTTSRDQTKNQEQFMAKKYDGVLVGTHPEHRHTRDEVENVLKTTPKLHH